MSKATQANKKANEKFSEIKLNIFFKNRVAFSRRRKPLPLPKLKPKQRLQGPGKQGWKVPTATKMEIRRSPTFLWPKALRLGRQPKYLQKSGPRRNKRTTTILSPNSPSPQSHHEENRRQQHAGSLWASRPTKHRIKWAVKRLYDLDVAKLSSLIRPDGEKKADIQLAPDYDALDVAHKFGII